MTTKSRAWLSSESTRNSSAAAAASVVLGSDDGTLRPDLTAKTALPLKPAQTLHPFAPPLSLRDT